MTRGGGRRLEPSEPVPALFVTSGTDLRLPDALRARIAGARAVVALSSHWAVMGAVRVTVGSVPPLLDDAGEEVPPATYPAKGHPALAREVAERLSEAGIFSELDRHRGRDSDVWRTVQRLSPDDARPIVQVSLSLGARPADVVEMGAALAPLRDEGVLLLGASGSARRSGASTTAPWVGTFEDWVAERVRLRDFRAPHAFLDAPYARLGHPSAEQFLPLFFVLGSALAGDGFDPLFEGPVPESPFPRSFALCASPGVVTQ